MNFQVFWVRGQNERNKKYSEEKMRGESILPNVHTFLLIFLFTCGEIYIFITYFTFIFYLENASVHLFEITSFISNLLNMVFQ